MIIAAILAGGLGARLRPVISDVPKSLAPIHGKPFLFLLLESLKANGIEEVVLLTGHMHDKIQLTCGDGSRWGLKIIYSQEHEPLGTAGAIKNAEIYLKDPSEFLVLNGDSYAPEAVHLLASQKLLPEQFALIAVSDVKNTERFGTIQFDPNSRVVKTFCEKIKGNLGFVNAGVYRLSNKIFNEIPAGKPVSLEQETFPHLLRTYPKSLGVVLMQQGFDDIGLPESYDAFVSKASHEN